MNKLGKQVKEGAVEVLSTNDRGGKIAITTSALDRQKDRVYAEGLSVENYMKNPVVQYGHNYREPWATVGKTIALNIDEQGRWVAEFELREPANEHDPQNIVLMLWKNGFLKAASIGFQPLTYKENDEGGLDFPQTDLLEWSLVPVPANQEALALAMKALEPAEEISEDTDTPKYVAVMVAKSEISPKQDIEEITDQPEANIDANVEIKLTDTAEFIEALKQFEVAINQLEEILK